MLEVIRQLVDSLQQGRHVVLCRLVETRGSTPQKAGALMLVFEDGSQAGTIGGGCVEAEVKRKALLALQRGTAELSQFQLDSDYGWGDGLICGGRMTVALQPFKDQAALSYFSQLVELTAADGGTEMVAFDADKTDLPTPSTYLFDTVGELVASLETDTADIGVAASHLRPISQRPRPYACNGMAYLPILPRCRLIIVGGGHVGKAVYELAADLDFDVWVTDDRDEFVAADRFPRAQCFAGPTEQVLPNLEITESTYCLIVTRGHNHDEQALYHLIDRGARYVGLIGSRRKINMIFEDLLGEGVSRESLCEVHAPVGIDIGSQTVAEIAVSIAAELVAHRNRAGEIPGRPAAVKFATDVAT